MAAHPDLGPVLPLVFDSVLARSGTGLVVLDEDLRFVLANGVAAEINGVPAEDHLGRPIEEVLPGVAEAVAPGLREVLETGRPKLDVAISGETPAAPGQRRWWNASYLRIEPPDAPPLVAVVFGDISDRVREAAKLAALADLSGRLSGAQTTDDVIRVLLDTYTLVDGASFVNLALHDPDSRALRLNSPAIVDDEVADRWAILPLEGQAPTPLSDAFLGNAPVYVRGPADRRARYPHLEVDVEAVGITATAALPLAGEDGRPIGALGVAWASPVDLGPSLVARLDLVADLCAQALQRARRTDATAALVAQLQEELLGAVEAPSGLDVAVAYRPGGVLGFGGDWYDLVELGDGRVAIVVGDVVGHGVSAAAQMAQTKGVVRALVLSVPLGDVLHLSSRSLEHLPGAYVGTASVALVDPTAATLSWVSAGHLPPLRRSPDGEAELLWTVALPPIGLVDQPTEPPTVPLPPGSLLVLYTDGLVERRGVDIDDRLELLRTVVAALPPDVDAASARDAVLAELAPTAVEDDVAIVVVRA